MLEKVLVLLIVATAVWTFKDATDTAADLYNNLPTKEEKRDFLAYNLAIVLDPNSKNQSDQEARLVNHVNIPSYRVKEYDDMDFPEDVSEVLYNWMQRKGNFTKTQMFRLLMNGWVCKPCVYLDNPGSNCCL